MAGASWIKLTTNMFDDDKIKMLESLPDKDALLIIWIKLLIQAGRTNASGYIYLNEKIPFNEESLACIFNRPINTIRLALSTFQKFGMLEIEEDGKIAILNWQKHQNEKGLDDIRKQNAQRQALRRERQKQALLEDGTKNANLNTKNKILELRTPNRDNNATGNVTCNATNHATQNTEPEKSFLPPELDKFTHKTFADYGVNPQDLQNALKQPTRPIVETERPLIISLLEEGCIVSDFKDAFEATVKEGKASRSIKYLQSRIRDARDMRKAGTLGKKPMTYQEIYAENVRLDALRTLGYNV